MLLLLLLLLLLFSSQCLVLRSGAPTTRPKHPILCVNSGGQAKTRTTNKQGCLLASPLPPDPSTLFCIASDKTCRVWGLCLRHFPSSPCIRLHLEFCITPHTEHSHATVHHLISHHRHSKPAPNTTNEARSQQQSNAAGCFDVCTSSSLHPA